MLHNDQHFSTSFKSKDSSRIIHYSELIRNYFLILQFVGIFAAKKQISLTKAGSIAEEVITAIKTVKAFGGQNKESER